MSDLINLIIRSGLESVYFKSDKSMFKFGSFSVKEVLCELLKHNLLHRDFLISHFITDDEALELMGDQEFVEFVSKHIDINFLIDLEDELFYYYIHDNVNQVGEVVWSGVDKDYFKVLDFCRKLKISKELQYQAIERMFIKPWSHTPYRLDISESFEDERLQCFPQAKYLQRFLECCYNQFCFDDDIEHLWKQQEDIGKSEETLAYMKTMGKRYYNRYVNYLLKIGYTSNTENIFLNIK